MTESDKPLVMVLGYHRYYRDWIKDCVNDLRYGALIISKPVSNYYEFEKAIVRFASTNDKLRGIGRPFDVVFVSPLMKHHQEEAEIMAAQSKLL